MKTNKIYFWILSILFCTNINAQNHKKTPFVWQNANVYFLLTDRFNNADKSNDTQFNRNQKTGKLRGFEGGDIKGITQKIEEGYFTKLGINAIWLTPIVEQIHEGVDEGTGYSYGFHGYWAKDWTALDPNFGTKDDLHKMVKAAHKKGIRIILDGVINHTGPATKSDPVWPNDWVRTEPTCTYSNYETTTSCTLVKNLPDVRTESTTEVNLPPHLIEKWKKEGRLDKEVASLDAFFKRTKYPRLPKYYIIKWLTDYITEFGIDGYRADTVKHTEEIVWADFKTQCEYAFEQWKKKNPKDVLDNNNFYTVAEVYNYGISGGQWFDFGDKKVNYFQNGFDSMINFEFKWFAKSDYETIFSKYSSKLQNELSGLGVLNYISSHDDGSPFDADRKKPFESATKLLLTPGTSQVYYGDESARSLVIKGTEGDATLRSNMNWNDIKNNTETQKILLHWQKLGQFRAKHPAVGAGIHQKITDNTYTFSRVYNQKDFVDMVVIALDAPIGNKTIQTGNIFKEGSKLVDAYSGKTTVVNNGKAIIDTPFDIVLFELK